MINVILPPSSDRSNAMAVLETWNPFVFDVFPIRLRTGVVVAAGKIYCYPHVPIGASISHDKIYHGNPKISRRRDLGMLFQNRRTGAKSMRLQPDMWFETVHPRPPTMFMLLHFHPSYEARQTMKLAVDELLQKVRVSHRRSPNFEKCSKLWKI